MRLRVNGGCQVIKICPGLSVICRSVTASISPAVYSNIKKIIHVVLHIIAVYILYRQRVRFYAYKKSVG